MDSEKQKTRRLHIGGEQRVAGWEILDVKPGPHVDHEGNADDLSRFPDDTFAEIYASHVLEHFDFTHKVLDVLQEWRRVLQPGGRLYVSVPDLEKCCEVYLKAKGQPEQRKLIMAMILGGHVDEHDYNLSGFDEDYLTRYLQEAGFHSVRRVDQFGVFGDSSRLKLLDVPISINVIARK